MKATVHTLIISYHFFYLPILMQKGGWNEFAVLAFLGIIVFAVIMILRGIGQANQRTSDAQKNAWYAYQDSLNRLKADPTNATLKQTTLQLGRTYSNWTRSNRGVTVYDEMALMNDINAACASATANLEFNMGNNRATEARLTSLYDLKQKGLIDDQEYNSRRQKILDEI